MGWDGEGGGTGGGWDGMGCKQERVEPKVRAGYYYCTYSVEPKFELDR